MPRHIEHVVNAASDAEVATVKAAHRAVAGQVQPATHFCREITLLKALRIVPDGADHGGPRAFDHQQAAGAIGHVFAGLIDDGGHDAGQGQRATARHQRRGTRQRGDHVATGFGLPKGVNDRAALASHMPVVPHPGLGIDRLANRAQDAQGVQPGAGWMHFFICLSGLDQGTDGRGRGVENTALVALYHLPETSGIGVGGNALKNDLGRPGCQRAVGYIRMAGDPADIGCAPEHIVASQVKGPVHGELGPQHKTASGMLHALGLAGRARGVENEQGVLGAHRFGRTKAALALQRLVKHNVTPSHHIAGRSGSRIHKNLFDRIATA